MNPKGYLPNLRPAKKGEVRNPNGRPPDPLNKALKQLTYRELQEIANLIIKSDVTGLKKVVTDQTESVIKVMICSACVNIIKKGDMHALDLLLNRLIGKVKDKIEHTGANGAPLAPSLSKMIKEADKEEVKKLLEKIENDV